MSKYYTGKRSRNIYSAFAENFRLSRSKIENFMTCKRCFYYDVRLGVAQPPGFPFNLNSAVDKLLKKEFDIHRAKNSKHPLMEAYGVDAVPFQHPKLEEWRDARGAGITYPAEGTNFLITGGIDDVWVNPEGELIIVDYKATSKNSEVNIDADWQISYKRQMEIYQWLFRKNGFKVSRTGYFVYCNGNSDKEAFDGRLEFDIKLIPYEGDDGWIDETVIAAHQCLNSDALPPASLVCDFCVYRRGIAGLLKNFGAPPSLESAENINAPAVLNGGK